MAMEILRPQDCIANRIRSHMADVYPRRRTFTAEAGNNARSGRNPVPRPDRKRHNRAAAMEPRRSKSEENLRHSNKNNGSLVSGQVTILRRGESLDSKMNTLKRRSETRPFLYAGSAFVVSPEPSDLPLPSFSKKTTLISAPVDDSATRDLRRLLRLE